MYINTYVFTTSNNKKGSNREPYNIIDKQYYMFRI